MRTVFLLKRENQSNRVVSKTWLCGCTDEISCGNVNDPELIKHHASYWIFLLKYYNLINAFFFYINNGSNNYVWCERGSTHQKGIITRLCSSSTVHVSVFKITALVSLSLFSLTSFPAAEDSCFQPKSSDKLDAQQETADKVSSWWTALVRLLVRWLEMRLQTNAHVAPCLFFMFSVRISTL